MFFLNNAYEYRSIFLIIVYEMDTMKISVEREHVKIILLQDSLKIILKVGTGLLKTNLVTFTPLLEHDNFHEEGNIHILRVYLGGGNEKLQESKNKRKGT